MRARGTGLRSSRSGAIPRVQAKAYRQPWRGSGAHVLTAFLSVSFVGDNQGFPLTPNAAYVCGYDKVLYEIDKAGPIDVVFVPSTDARFRMVALNIKGDTANEYGAQKSIADRQLSFSAANVTAQTIYFAVTVEDTLTGKQFESDPQVENMPPD